MNSKIVIVISTKEVFNVVSGGLKMSGYEPFHYEGPSSLSKINVSNVIAILDVFNNLDSEMVKDFLDYAVFINAKYIYVYTLKERNNPNIVFIKKLINDYKRYKGLKSVVLEIGDVYGKEFSTSGKIGEYLDCFVNPKPLVVENDYNRHFFLHLEDLLNGLVTAVSGDVLGTYALHGRDSILEIELANFVNDLSDIKQEIEYSNTEDSKKLFDIDIVLNILPGWEETISLEEGLLEMFEAYDIPSYISVREEITDEKVKIAQDTLKGKASLAEKRLREKDKIPLSTLYNVYERDKDRNLKTSMKDKRGKILKEESFEPSLGKVKAIIFTAVFVFLVLMSPSFVYAINFTKAKVNVKRSFESFEKKDFQNAKKYSIVAANSVENLSHVPSVVRFGFSLFKLDGPSLGEYVSIMRNGAYLIESSSIALLNETLNDKVLGVSNAATDKADLILYQIGDLEKETGLFRSDLDLYNSVINDNLVVFNSVEPFSELIHSVLGIKREQRFLVVLQDDSVLRANGGRIYEFGILTVENGKAVLEEGVNLDEINSKFDSHGFSPSPTDFKSFSKESFYDVENLALSQDFSINANKWLEVMKSYSNESFDGVVSINSSWLKSMFASDSKVSIKDIVEEKDSLSVDNFFLNVLFGLKDKDIQLFFVDNTFESMVVDNRWSVFPRVFDGDFVYVSDSNIGNSGVEGDIERSVKYQGYDPISDSSYNRKLTLEYKNNGDVGFFNNFEVMVPKDSVLESFKLIDNGEVKDIYRDVLVKSNLRNTTFESDLYIEAGHVLSIEAVYASPRKLLDDGVLNVLFEKQPGVNYSKLLFEFDGGNHDTYEFDKDIEISSPIFRLAKEPS